MGGAVFLQDGNVGMNRHKWVFMMEHFDFA